MINPLVGIGILAVGILDRTNTAMINPLVGIGVLDWMNTATTNPTATNIGSPKTKDIDILKIIKTNF